jgi:hypothetical protein
MRFLLDNRGTGTAEWVVVGALVIAVIGTVIFAIANSAAVEGNNTNAWIQAIPDP